MFPDRDPNMKICIASESHDRALPLAAAVNQAKAAGALAVIHCGVLIGANTLRTFRKLGVQLHLVYGNNLGDIMTMHNMITKSGGMRSIMGRTELKLSARLITLPGAIIMPFIIRTSPVFGAHHATSDTQAGF